MEPLNAPLWVRYFFIKENKGMERADFRDRFLNFSYPLGGIVLIFLLWQSLVVFFKVPSYILPLPSSVIKALYDDYEALHVHALTTLFQGVFGFLGAVIFGFLAAVWMDAFPRIKKTLFPLLILSQTVPVVALAPLFILWFGFGMLPKVLVVMTVCFFPITLSLVDGFDKVDKDYLDYFRTLKAGRWKIFYHLKFPHAMVHFFSGLKISATYMVMGSVIGEWLGAQKGIGVYMLRAKNAYALDRVFAAILVIVVMSVLLVYAMDRLMKKIIFWK
jgi:ABC-type nitrate/sulfonate/bicarbonate transport system permease component